MGVNYDMNKMKRLIQGRFDELNLKLESIEIDGDFLRYRAALTLMKKSFTFRGVIGNHGFGNFECVFGEVAVKADSLIAVNAFNDACNLCKATISRRGQNGTYRLVFNRGTQYMTTEEAMAGFSMGVINDLLDDDNEESVKKLFGYLLD